MLAPRTVKKACAVEHISDPRNGALMKMFNLIDVGERIGSGIPSIYYVWKEQGWDEPTITQSYSPDRVRLSLPLIRKRL